MRVAFLSPLPPSRTGVAHYSSMILPLLRERFDVTAFDSLRAYRPDEFDLPVYQLGNNPRHEFVYEEAMRRPGVAVLHEIVLHHLIVEITLARGDAEGYIRALEASHGAAGAAWARGRTMGLHSEMGNFLYPASIDLARRSRAVIVHNRWAAERLRSFDVETPLFVVPHPYESERSSGEREAVRAALGIAPDQRLIGMFGFLTSAKRAAVVAEGFRMARRRNPSCRLLVIGEPSPDIDMALIEGEGVLALGYLEDEEFGRYYAAADRLVNLRYPSAGEASGTLMRAFAAGKPVAVSDYAQFTEFPDDCVVRIPFGEGEAAALAEFFLREYDNVAIAAAQRDWLQRNATVDRTVDGYVEAIAGAGGFPVPAGVQKGSLPLFSPLTLAGVAFREEQAVLTLRNEGDVTVRARVYGEPGYRAVVKLFDGERELADHWLQLGGDVVPGATSEIRVPLPAGSRSLTLRWFHALEGIPLIDPVPAAEVEIGV